MHSYIHTNLYIKCICHTTPCNSVAHPRAASGFSRIYHILHTTMTGTASGEQDVAPGITASFLRGQQSVARFKESARNAVTVFMANIRLPSHGTDIVVSMTVPTCISQESSSFVTTLHSPAESDASSASSTSESISGGGEVATTTSTGAAPTSTSLSLTPSAAVTLQHALR